MFGYRFSLSEEEQLHLRHLFASAMDRRSPVRVSYFKEKRVKVWSERTQGYVERSTGLYVKVTRVVEPYAFDRIYGAWWELVVATDAKAALDRSARRYLAHLGLEL